MSLSLFENERSPFVGLRIPRPTVEVLKTEAARRNESLSGFIRILIDSSLRERARRCARKATKTT